MAQPPSSDARFRRLFDAYHEAMRDYCLRRLPVDDVNDAVADVFLVAWRRIADVPAGDEARLWLYGVARNVVANQRRRSRRSWRLMARLGSLGQTQDPSPEMITVRREEDREVLSALEGLRPQDQELLRLKVWEEMGNGEIAAVLGTTAHAVDMRLTRARNKLAAALAANQLGRARQAGTRPLGQGGEQ